MNYFKRVLIAVDQLAGTVLIGSMPDETISAAAHRRGWKRTEKVIDTIFWWDKDHCKNSYLSELNGTQNHPGYR